MSEQVKLAVVCILLIPRSFLLMHYISHISAFYRRNLCHINELGKPLLTLETRSLIMN